MPELNGKRMPLHAAAIEVPIAEVPATTLGLHLNTHLSLTQSLALRRVTAALVRQLARLSNGRRVVSASDTLKYLLDQVCADK